MDLVNIQCQNGNVLVFKSTLEANCPKLYSKIQYLSDIECGVIFLDFPTAPVHQIIEFLERGGVSLNSIHNALEIYALSKLCEFERLKMESKGILIENINIQNVCSVHDLAQKYSLPDIQYICWKLFDSNWREIFEGDDFIQCNEETIVTFLSRGKYTSLTEYDLFRAVYKWVLRKVSIQESVDPKVVIQNEDLRLKFRTVMDRFLPMIRFLAMSREVLEDGVFPLNFLSSNEREAIRRKVIIPPISLLICSSDTKRTEVNNSDLFVYKKRHNLGHRNTSWWTLSFDFHCEIFVKYNCLLISAKLPIKFDCSTGTTVDLQIYSGSEPSPFNIQQLDCNREGKIELKEIIFLQEKTTTRLNVKIPDASLYRKISIDAERDYFMTEEQHQRLAERKLVRNQKYWHKLYFNVDLYF